MRSALTNLSFEEWVLFVFDHPVDESKLEWYWNLDEDWWDGPTALTVDYLTRTFENSTTVFQPYTDSQLNQGLWYIVSNACSNHMFALMDASVSWAERRRCIRSFYTLYEQCFAKRCTPHLSHLDEAGAGRLNAVCYMWWDIIPISGRPEDPNHKEMNQELLQVMESALQLDSIACQESALHGLGHWQLYYSEKVTKIIDRFLAIQKNLPDALRTYAVNAARGCVL